MKKIKNSSGNDIVYHNPVFKEITVEGEINHPLFGKGTTKRDVTLCQTSIVTDAGIVSTIGVAITNPSDTKGDLGKTISEGRAIKSPIKDVTIVSLRKLPKPIAEEQFTWAAKHIERNLDGYVNNIREMLR